MRRTLRHPGIPPTTFYRWDDDFQVDGIEALVDRPSRPDRVWNRIPDPTRDSIVELVLVELPPVKPELSLRELAVRFTEQTSYLFSATYFYCLFKAHDLITGPAFIVVKATDEFHTKNCRNKSALADRLHLPEGGWCWFYLDLAADGGHRG